MAGFREINVAGPMYRGAPYPKFNPKKINESKFEDGLRAKRWEASINLAENTGHVVWESQEDENSTSAWENDSDWHHIGEQLNFEICWSEEKQLYFIAEYHRAQSGRVDTSRRNWGRTRARKIFMNEVAKLEDSLTNAGFQIGELKETSTVFGWKRGLEYKFIDCTGPEVMA